MSTSIDTTGVTLTGENLAAARRVTWWGLLDRADTLARTLDASEVRFADYAEAHATLAVACEVHANLVSLSGLAGPQVQPLTPEQATELRRQALEEVDLAAERIHEGEKFPADEYYTPAVRAAWLARQQDARDVLAALEATR